jgi:hypothetical protein
MPRLRTQPKFAPVSAEQLRSRADRLESVASMLCDPQIQLELLALAAGSRRRAAEMQPHQCPAEGARPS